MERSLVSLTGEEADRLKDELEYVEILADGLKARGDHGIHPFPGK
jgi:hypothetical protein